MDTLLKLSRAGTSTLPEIIADLRLKGRKAACSYLSSLLENVSFTCPHGHTAASFAVELLTTASDGTPGVIELSDRQDALVRIAAKIYIALDLTLQELETCVPAQAVPYTLLALDAQQDPSAHPHPVRDPLVLISRHLLRTVAAGHQAGMDITRITTHAEFVEKTIESLRPEACTLDCAVACQLSYEAGAYRFARDEFDLAGSLFRTSRELCDQMSSAHQVIPYCTITPSEIDPYVTACHGAVTVKSPDTPPTQTAITTEGDALAFITKSRTTKTFDIPQLEDLFLSEIGRRAVPLEMKKAVVEECRAAGRQSEAACLATCIALGTGDAFDIPSSIITDLQTSPTTSQPLAAVFTRATSKKYILPPIPQTALSLCHRVSRPDIWETFISTGIVPPSSYTPHHLTPPTKPPTVPTPAHLRMHLLTTLPSTPDLSLYLSPTLSIPPHHLLPVIHSHARTALKNQNYTLTEQLLSIIPHLLAGLPLGTPQVMDERMIAELRHMQMTVELWKLAGVFEHANDAGTGQQPDLRFLEVLFTGLGKEKFLPDLQFMEHIFIILVRRGGLYDYIKALATHLLTLTQNAAFAHPDRASVLCLLAELVASCVLVFSHLPVGEDDIKTLQSLATDLPKLAATKEAIFRLATLLGNPGIATQHEAHRHLLTIILKAVPPPQLTVFLQCLSGVVVGLQAGAGVDVVRRMELHGPWAHLTDNTGGSGPLPPSLTPHLPALRTPIPTQSQLTAQAVPYLVVFVKGVYARLLDAEDDGDDGGKRVDVRLDRATNLVRIAECCCVSAEWRDALGCYMDALAILSMDFGNMPAIEHLWGTAVLPKMVLCAEMCGEHLAAATLTQLSPTLNVLTAFECVEKALDRLFPSESSHSTGNDDREHDDDENLQMEREMLARDGGYQTGVVSVLWNVDVLEFGIATLKRRGTAPEMLNLLIKATARPELSCISLPGAKEAYVGLVLGRYLRWLRARVGAAGE
ncbi:uncharacterized protein EV422DRAFT_513176 [Fimicolochytrium jonesii]|uniref:uncharacterized protein n=1 Tax=Fimicolochytrium jonesii TaxID=1396493 RepID=UPI0022FE3B36|nr:uncharacterized protein EV422DRAFT_513176 [Fimicolochytrium jonesii]KAI8827242.1 hypothetical protein EV422DRAFT_513176 [Fimicolochytrium jonesii]